MSRIGSNKRAKKWKAKAGPGRQELFNDVRDIMVQQIHGGDAASALIPSLISTNDAAKVTQAIAAKLKP